MAQQPQGGVAKSRVLALREDYTNPGNWTIQGCRTRSNNTLHNRQEFPKASRMFSVLENGAGVRSLAHSFINRTESNFRCSCQKVSLHMQRRIILGAVGMAASLVGIIGAPALAATTATTAIATVNSNTTKFIRQCYGYGMVPNKSVTRWYHGFNRHR